MKLKKLQHQLLTLTYTFLWLLTCLNVRSLAETSTFKPPSDGAPGRREDAGSRPLCPAPTGSFAALIPATNFGKTAAENPTFWLYSPYPSGSVELILEDEISKKQVYKTTFETNKGPGIISYRLPETAPSLEIDKKYRWRFFFFCNSANQADFMSINGVIVRENLPAEVQTQLENATSPLERADLYGANGFWYEMVHELATLQRTSNNPEITTAWTNLLQHPTVRLEKMVSVPVVSCCTVD
ncbi:DUF928 domain-containing protein [Microcoleus sp. FACHB-672]|uniref:DUF928 domain-containing protein n=1 Tax=Microcoleus sp. FACHB-672 TaxID=2692825 RepID=UPI0016895CD9|nr:DUF928 domain-containing protein [Microcoleus sp. FACHB-672]MBD2042884.1 DUF928 domain-containing protein [Microcoleus sp. FACHB-672]